MCVRHSAHDTADHLFARLLKLFEGDRNLRHPGKATRVLVRQVATRRREQSPNRSVMANQIHYKGSAKRRVDTFVRQQVTDIEQVRGC